MKNRYIESVKHSIILFWMLFVLYAVVYMTKNMFSAAMATIVEQGIMTKSQTGAISAAFWFVYAFGQVAGGFAADRFSPFRLLIIGLAGGIFSNTVIYFNQSYGVIIGVWCLNAALQFGLWPSIFKILSTQTALSFRATAIFWILFPASIGEMTSLFVASIVTEWQQNFLICAIALTIALIGWIIIYKTLGRHMTGEEVPSKLKDDFFGEKLSIGKLMRISGLPILMTIGFLVTMLLNGIKMVTPVMLMESYEELPATISTRLGIIMIAFSIIGMFVAGFVRSKITRHEIKAVALLLVISIPVIILATFVGKIHFAVILLFLAITLALMQGLLPFVNTFAASRFVTYGRGATVSGLLNSAGCVGNIIASYVFARLSEIVSWNVVVLIWCGAIVIAIVLAVCLIKLWTSFTEEKV